ncbi:MAG: urea transporter [Gemmataceae bacterium]|nr:urea transporter [Gemmataceae bacterium]
MSKVDASVSNPIGPDIVTAIFRGIGQVFFQENAITGGLFTLGIALSSPVMALGLVIGSALGTVVACFLGFDRKETAGGIYGFNSALVGIATFFFFQPGVVSICLLIVGSILAAPLTRLMRSSVPFPTYTSPFILITWCLFFLGQSLGAASTDPSVGPLVANAPTGHVFESTMHGVGQVMFQASIWTGILFLVGIGISDWRHAAWVAAGAYVGMLVAGYHLTGAAKSLDPERLIERSMFTNISLGLYGYNATLAPVALFLWRRKLIPAILGMLLTVPLTEMVPYLGLPALTLPFVLATWLVLAFGWLEQKYLGDSPRS